MTLGEILVLLQSARRRYRTLEALLHLRVRPDLRCLAGDREWEERVVLGLSEPSPYGHDHPPPEVVEEQARLRVGGRTSWRVEYFGSESHVEMRDGDRCESTVDGFLVTAGRNTNTQTPRRRVQPFEQFWDPALLIAELLLEPHGMTEVAGRPGIVVHATPRPTRRPDGTEFQLLCPRADAYELVVDTERGIVLRFRAVFAGELMMDDEMLTVVFDRSAPEDAP